MSFEDNLANVVAVSDLSWAPFWMDYKHLMTLIKEIMLFDQQESQTTMRFLTDMTKSPVEVNFFRALRYELQKTERFFHFQESLCLKRKVSLECEFNVLKVRHSYAADDCMINMILVTCVQFFKDVLLLENFAILNYCAFCNILAKHDKVTRYLTPCTQKQS